MPTITDDARIQNALRLNSQSDSIPELIFDKTCDPLMAMMESVQDNENPGAGFVLQVATRGGVGPNPSWSLAGQNAEDYKKVTLSAKDLNWRAKWTRNAMIDAAAQGSKGVFNLAKSKIDREMRWTRDTIAKLLEGDGWGTLAYISSISGSTITVGTATATPVPSLANRFYKGQVINAAASPSSGNKRGSSPGDALTVLSVDVNTGIVTFTSAVGGTAFANGDALSEYGYRPYAASSGQSCLSGLDYWLPLAAVTDSADYRYQIDELQPLRFPVTGMTIKNALIAADEFAYTCHLPVNDPMFLVAPQQYRQLAQSAQANQIVNLSVTRKGAEGEEYKIGFRGFALSGMRGDIPVVPSAYVTPGRYYYGDFKDPKVGFKLAYSGQSLVNIEQTDGRMFRLAAENGVTDNSSVVQSGFVAEGYSRIQMLCKHPGHYLNGTGLGE
jgi:hypothetical protein